VVIRWSFGGHSVDIEYWSLDFFGISDLFHQFLFSYFLLFINYSLFFF